MTRVNPQNPNPLKPIYNGMNFQINTQIFMEAFVSKIYKYFFRNKLQDNKNIKI